MSDTEFDIIRRYFTRQDSNRKDVITGIGDDAALLQVPAGMELVVCMDTLVDGVHFPTGTPAAAIGHKTLAVNLSDLAAMGAEPAWVTLSLTIPESGSDWLADFSQAFFKLADRYQVQLVGGDTTQGPLAVTVQAHGFVPDGLALRRRGAQAGDHIYVTGTLGDAGLALLLAGDAGADLQHRLDYPEPRVAAGQALRGIASAAIDVSDGLLADLGHLLESDQLGAALSLDDLPRSTAFSETVQRCGADARTLYLDLPLSAGDDYELCFTVPEAALQQLATAQAQFFCACTYVGRIEATPGIRCYTADGETYEPATAGYQHFGVSQHG
ncbi:MAG TPA: thiamine-phosphate kinase [Gammaproteobacteria bacterium]|nr:thiamine-phosphate kinase [Gammaproteobacteria bacterium]